MEKFINLKTAYSASSIDCIFEDDNIVFLIVPKNDILEFGKISKSLLDFSHFKNILLEINTVYELIDYFNFEQK